MNDDSLEETLQKASMTIILTDTPDKLSRALDKYLLLFITHATSTDEKNS